MKVAVAAVVAVFALAAGGAGTAGARSASFSWTTVVGGLQRPVYVTSTPGSASTLYIVQQTGKILIERGGKIVGTFLNLTSSISCCGEQGLLSMAFSPQYATNHLFYVSYTDTNGNSRVVQYTAARGKGVPSSAKQLLFVEQPYSNHNGGLLQFDKRGYLYIGFGDGGSGGDPQQNAQNMHTRLGKLLRSATTTPSTAWKIVALGLRNPWRYSFDSANDNLWIGDVGQDKWEEVDFRSAGKLDQLANYGWSHYEGNSVYDSSHPLANVGQLVFPKLVYGHVNGQCAIVGGYVYRGSAVPAADGRYFYGDDCAGTVWSFAVGTSGRASAPVVAGNVGQPSSFGTDADGNLYAIDLGGTVYELSK